MSRKILHGTLIALAGTTMAIALWLAGGLDRIENQSWDMRVSYFTGKEQPSANVCLIFIDQYSLDWAEKHYGLTWPWMRQAYVYILDFLKRADAKAVCFDLIFSEESSSGVEDDFALGRAVAKTPNYAQAFMLSNEEGVETWPDELRNKVITSPGLDKFIKNNRPATFTLPKASFPVLEIATNVTVLGSAYSRSGKDAITRKSPVFQIFDNKFVPSLGLATYLAANPDCTVRARKNSIVVDSRSIPLDENGYSILRYRGPTRTHKTFNAAAIIQSEAQLREGKKPAIDPSEFKDSYVLLGGTAPGLLDLRATPVSQIYPGVEIHATMLDNLLTNDFMKDFSLTGIMILAFGLAIIAGIGGRLCAHLWQMILLAAILIPLPVFLGMIAYDHGYWMNISLPATSVVLSLTGIICVNYAIEGKQKRFIKGAFKQYLSPDVIERLVQNPDRLQLGGESKELSIFFSDVQGFTSISEKLSPEKLTNLLNRYLTAMTDIIMEQGGTIDKYEGDAIIAFWNAPVELADHPVRAVRAALLCQDKLAALRPDFKQISGQNIRARIGLNTGPVVVGNMGSNQRFDYTFLGDAGNLAARLEGINKQFGTYVMISEFTKKHLNDQFATRELSRVLVVGKKKPVTVYEPMWKETFESEKDKYNAFSRALDLYYNGRFKDAESIFATIENDPPSTRYVERCRQLIDNPPDTWDGAWQMTEK